MRSLMYLTTTQPDIMYSVSVFSRFMEHPKEVHFIVARIILMYLQEMSSYGILYKKGVEFDLIRLIDSDFVRDTNDRKSTSEYVFMFRSRAISWSSKKKPIVTLSTIEAEFVASTTCACHAIWLGNVFVNVYFPQEGPTPIYCDNNSTIKLSKDPVLHGRTKHIDVKFHFLTDFMKN
ncbi:hypothetical protein J1N35_029234 [Gossypium stocksii]|uniref:Reverse transcriptase Ty1/copia-type domain-containing protein n=1 Tax=Gossypium stocksii TaxID=47602 RepID=A0A9D3UXI2_9ROSI|nr:hypothetical protein J1N35_029234 [Gossypium stocksii]